MIKRVAVALVLVLAVGCGGDDSDDAASDDTTTTTSAPEADETTTTEAPETETTAAGGDCDAAIDDVTEAIDTLLSRAEADPDSAAQESQAITDVMTELGTNLGTSCRAQPGEALSAIVVHIAEQANGRGDVAREVANGLLSGLCSALPPGIELDSAATVACATSGG